MRHNIRMPCFTLVLCLLFASPSALAWNAAGHRIVALIAWQQLSPQAQDKASSLLAAHPDYPRWIAKRSSTDDTRRLAFLEASTWPDDIRKDPRFYDEMREASTPPLAGLVDTRRHRHWHYIDFSEQKSTGPGELDIQPQRLALILSSSNSQVEKTYALPWFIHLLGDTHQPLHVGLQPDRGGNLFTIEDPDNARLPISNLHRWWDDLPGPPWLRGRYLEEKVEGLLQRHPSPLQTETKQWLAENQQLTYGQVYPPTQLITSKFRRQAQAIMERRLVEAGWRLGRWLNALLSEVPRGTNSE